MQSTSAVSQTGKSRLAPDGELWSSKTEQPASILFSHTRYLISPSELSNKLKFTTTSKSSPTQGVDFLRWLNRSVLGLHILLVMLSITLPVSAAETCNLATAIHTFRYENCLPARLLVPVCLGSCRGYTVTNPSDPATLNTMCTCCQALEFRNLTVNLRCNRPNRAVGYMHATTSIKAPRSCMCRPCESLPEIRAAELSS